jgi:hypothetical protein
MSSKKQSKHVKINLKKNKRKKITPNNVKTDLSFIAVNKKQRKLTHILYKKVPTMKEYIGALDKGNKELMSYIKVGGMKKYDNLFAYKIDHKPAKKYVRIKFQPLVKTSDVQIVHKIPYNKNGSVQDKIEKVEYKAKKYVIAQSKKVLKRAKYE